MTMHRNKFQVGCIIEKLFNEWDFGTWQSVSYPTWKNIHTSSRRSVTTIWKLRHPPLCLTVYVCQRALCYRRDTFVYKKHSPLFWWHGNPWRALNALFKFIHAHKSIGVAVSIDNINFVWSVFYYGS